MDINNHVNLDPHLQLRLIEAEERKGPLSEHLKVKKIQLLMKTRLYDQLQSAVLEVQPNNTTVIQSNTNII